MGCSEWERRGLLYTSGELSDDQRREYEHHLETCGECREELDGYRGERNRLFTVSMLGEQPSTDTDREIRRLCGGRRPLTAIGLFAAVVRKPVAAATLFLLLGVGTGTYVAYNLDNARRMAAPDSANTRVLAADSVRGGNEVAAAEGGSAADSSLDTDSSADTTPFPRARTEPSEGVVPVDLANENQ